MTPPKLYNLKQHESIISFSGEDAGTFLQGQVTCDINSLNENNSLFGSLCNPKGRVITLFYLFKRSNILYMVTPNDLADAIVKRLKMFVFRSKVSLQQLDDAYTILGSTNNSILADQKTLASINLPGSSEHTLHIVDNAISDTTQEASFGPAENWYLQLIMADIPRVTKATTEQFIPQTLNLDILDGISFTKGCYTGQEIVARLHYKGSVKRRLCLFEAKTFVPLGTNLIIVGGNNSIGTVVDCQPNDNKSYSGTVVVKLEHSTGATLNCVEFGDVSINPPPYPLSTE